MAMAMSSISTTVAGLSARIESPTLSNSVIFGKEDPNKALSDAASKINSLVK